MKIWAHSMVKNEGKWLWYSISSIIPFVDKVLLWDTGSSDTTLDIIHSLLQEYPHKIDFRKRVINSPDEFKIIRQEMLDTTEADWFLMVDGDEVWWRDSAKRLVNYISSIGDEKEYVVVPSYNLVGDMFHYQDNSSGGYNFGKYKGHFNLRAINRKIPGLKSLGEHGLWGWAREGDVMIQNNSQEKMGFVYSPYIHATNISRSSSIGKDNEVYKREKKLKYELGISFPLDFYYPEVFFERTPDFIESPWQVMNKTFFLRSAFETPLRKLKRKLFRKSVGY